MRQLETLYIVDDDETYQFILTRIISESSAVKRVQSFLNGRDAIESLTAVLDQPLLIPEIILLDLTMPVMDGWQFLENYLLLKPRIGKKVHIYIASSSVDPNDVERARNIEIVSDYVVKPVTRDRFLGILGNIAKAPSC
jgi:CheY-like chemotaxis protein